MDIQPQYIVAIVMTALAGVAWYMITEWKRTWETRLTAQDERLDLHSRKHASHDVNHARLTSDLDHITKTTEEISKDVKSLLIQSNGSRTGS